MKRNRRNDILVNSRRRHVSVIVAAGLAALAAFVFSATTAAAAVETYEEKFLKTESLPANGKVYLSNISGDIRISTWSRNEVKIDAVKRSIASTLEKAKENAGKIKIVVSREDGRLNIETKYPEGRTLPKKFNVSVDYTLTVPAAAGVSAHTVSGDIRAQGMDGLAKLVTVSGTIEATKMNNDGEYTTVSGNIDLEDIAGAVEATDISGSISLSGLSGIVTAETISGNVVIVDLSASKSVNINVHSGEITFDSALHPSGRYSFATHSGPVIVTLPKNAAFDFECETFSGDIRSDFKAATEMTEKMKRLQQELQERVRELEGHERELQEREKELQEHVRELRNRERDIRGIVNGGGPEITITTFSGTITLKRRD